MRKPRSALVLLVLLGLAVSLAVPAEDLPETVCGESETQPYESTPLFSIAVQQTSGRTASAELRNGSLLLFDYSTKRGLGRGQGDARHRVLDSRTILNHALRC